MSPYFDANRSPSVWLRADIDVWLSPVRERGAYRIVMGSPDPALNESLLPRIGGWPLAVMDDFGNLRGVQP